MKSNSTIAFLAVILLGAALYAENATTPPTAVPADNSGTNARIEKNNEPTAQTQASGTNDTELTRQIRQAVVKDKKVSIYGENVKIITENGVVTLKGPVHTLAEKKEIGNLAKKYAKNRMVHNELEITQ